MPLLSASVVHAASCCRPGLGLTPPRSSPLFVRRYKPTQAGGKLARSRSRPDATTSCGLIEALLSCGSARQPAAGSGESGDKSAVRRDTRVGASQNDVLASVNTATLLPNPPSNGQGITAGSGVTGDKSAVSRDIRVGASQNDLLTPVDTATLLPNPPTNGNTAGGGRPPEPEVPRDDRDKEASRKYRRTVFDFQRWREHRSTARYWRHIRGILGSRIARGLAGPLWGIVLLSAAVGAYETSRAAGLLPEYMPTVCVTNTAPFNLSSFALSLLLVFRTNSSYGRWDEARKLWGSVTNRTRDLVRQAEAWLPEADQDLLDIVARWTIAYPRSLMCHLREDGDLESELRGILPEPELRALLAAQHRPNYVQTVLSTAIEEANIPDAARVRLDENVMMFSDTTGACERILKTPIPLTYTRHTSRFLVIWLTFMPFTLWKPYGWGTIPASVAIAFLLLGIEEIGVQIEEPFGILPLEVMCNTMKTNITEMHQKRREVRSLVLSSKTTNNSDGGSDPRPYHERAGDSKRPLFR